MSHIILFILLMFHFTSATAASPEFVAWVHDGPHAYGPWLHCGYRNVRVIGDKFVLAGDLVPLLNVCPPPPVLTSGSKRAQEQHKARQRDATERRHALAQTLSQAAFDHFGPAYRVSPEQQRQTGQFMPDSTWVPIEGVREWLLTTLPERRDLKSAVIAFDFADFERGVLENFVKKYGSVAAVYCRKGTQGVVQ